MATTPAPIPATAQLQSLFDSLPSLINQVRAGKVAPQTVVQVSTCILSWVYHKDTLEPTDNSIMIISKLRMIIPRHRKQAAEYLASKNIPDPFLNLPDVLDPSKPLTSKFAQVQEEVSKSLQASSSTPNRGATRSPASRPASESSQTSAPDQQSTSSQRPLSTTPQPAHPLSQTTGTSPAASPAPSAAGTTSTNNNNTLAVNSNAAPPVKRPSPVAPGGKYTWQEIFVMTDQQRQKWFDEIPEAKSAWDRIYTQAARARGQNQNNATSATGTASGPNSRASSPATTGALPASSMGRNPNTAAADFLAKNPPPVPHLALPPSRSGSPAVSKPPAQSSTSTGGTASTNANPYAFLATITPRPSHLDPNNLTKTAVEFYINLSDVQAQNLTQEQREVRDWVKRHVDARRARNAEEQARLIKLAQAGQYGSGFKTPLPPGAHSATTPSTPSGHHPSSSSSTQPTRPPLTVQSIAQEIQRFKEREGRPISLEAVKDLCRRQGTPWTLELERGLEPLCTPVRPLKTSKQILSEQVREVAVGLTGSVLDESLEKVGPCIHFPSVSSGNSPRLMVSFSPQKGHGRTSSRRLFRSLPWRLSGHSST